MLLLKFYSHIRNQCPKHREWTSSAFPYYKLWNVNTKQQLVSLTLRPESADGVTLSLCLGHQRTKVSPGKHDTWHSPLSDNDGFPLILLESCQALAVDIVFSRLFPVEWMTKTLSSGAAPFNGSHMYTPPRGSPHCNTAHPGLDSIISSWDCVLLLLLPNAALITSSPA